MDKAIIYKRSFQHKIIQRMTNSVDPERWLMNFPKFTISSDGLKGLSFRSDLLLNNKKRYIRAKQENSQ